VILGFIVFGVALLCLSGIGVWIQLRLNTQFTTLLSVLKESGVQQQKDLRDELHQHVRTLQEHTSRSINDAFLVQKQQLELFSHQLQQLNTQLEERMERIRTTVDMRMVSLQEDNSKKLELMRQTVDEKLHATLETRLGQSFQLVSDKLEQVHKGLGEMQSLASGVGDLKKVLNNVKTRGIWGEIQLEALLEQMLSMDQYAKNVKTKAGSADAVEFAIRLPGKSQENPVWLPIDSKFPQDTYQALIEAQDQGNLEKVDESSKLLEQRFKLEVKTIREKYIDPPQTTDFGILFVPIEGLYAEVLRRPALMQYFQDMKILLAGPSTLSALLNSLQMGFRTLAIEKRSSEVWTLLGGVKTEFGKLGDLLDKTHKKLQEAGNTIEDATRKTRTIERRLRDVQELPVAPNAETPLFSMTSALPSLDDANPL